MLVPSSAPPVPVPVPVPTASPGATVSTVRHAGGFSPTLCAASIASLVGVYALQFPTPVDWMETWRGVLELGASLWATVFVAAWSTLTLARGALWWLGRRTQTAKAHERAAPMVPGEAGTAAASETSEATFAVKASQVGSWASRHLGRWAALLLLVCTLETALHSDERNPFVATSRPTSGVVDWTGADGYATVLDGHIAQGDGLFLLPLLNLFLGDSPPSPSEFDRRAGHLFLVSLLARPLGAYWAFTAVNLLSWWAASLAVWWLARRRWPGNGVPEIAALLTATGQGFVFMSTAPQAHAPAFAAFALVLVLADALGVWRPEARVSAWLRAGWAAGAAGLIYLVYLPCALVFWFYGLGRTRLVGLIAGSVLMLAIVFGWERFATATLGLSFSGGNNDLAGEALRGWIAIAQLSPAHLVGQFRGSSTRGLLVGAFYYPWWLFAFAGLVASSRDARRWALAVIVAAALPAIAFTTRFNLPRVAYFMYPALYPLVAAGIVWITAMLPGSRHWLRRGAIALLVASLIALTNADVVGLDQLALWFHHSQGTWW